MFSGMSNTFIQVLSFGFGVGGVLVSAFAPSVLPLKYQQFGFYAGLLILCVASCAFLLHTPYAQLLAERGWPRVITITSGVIFIVGLGWWILSSSTARSPQPIDWQFDGFIGGSKKQGVQAHAAVFQTSGINKSDDFVSFKDAYIRSRRTGQRTDVTISTDISGDNPYVAPAAHDPIPPGVKVYAHALFYDPGNPYSEFGLEGMPEDLFLQEFGEFDFVVQYAGDKSFLRAFAVDEVKEQFRMLGVAQ